MDVYSALNLNQCRPGLLSYEGMACWSIRGKPQSTSKVLEYRKTVLLRRATFHVNAAGLRKVQRAGVKSVFAFVGGEDIDPASMPSGLTWYRVAFSPVLPPKGLGEDEFHLVIDGDRRHVVRNAAWFYGVGNRGIVALPEPSPTRRNPTRVIRVTSLDAALARHGIPLIEA